MNTGVVPTRAVIFDLDDTLFPEREYAFSGFAAVARAFPELLGNPGRAVADMRRLYDTPQRARVFDALLAERGLPTDRITVERMIAAYRNHSPTIALHTDADAVLTALHRQVRLGLISDGPGAMQRAKVDALRLAQRLDEVILTDELGPGLGKPHSRAFELMAQRLGVSHSGCMYVADNAGKDFVAPNALGWKTVQIRRADGVYQASVAVSGGRPQDIIDSLLQIQNLL